MSTRTTTTFSPYQQSLLGVSAAKARAITEFSQAQTKTGVTALYEMNEIERAVREINKEVKEEQEKARRRQGKIGIGRLIGSALGFAIGGPAGSAALGTALGGLAGTAAAGGFKRYKVGINKDKLPTGYFYGGERQDLRQRVVDIERAFKQLTKDQRTGIVKNLAMDYLTGRGLGKLGAKEIGTTGQSLDSLLQAGEITKGEYLADIFKSAVGGLSDERVTQLSGMADTINKEAITTSAYANVGVGRDILEKGRETVGLDPSSGLALSDPRVQLGTQDMKVGEFYKPSNVMKDGLFPTVTAQRNLLNATMAEDLAMRDRFGRGSSGMDLYNQLTNPAAPTLVDQKAEDVLDAILGEDFTPDKIDDISFNFNSGVNTNKRNSLFQQTVGPMIKEAI